MSADLGHSSPGFTASTYQHVAEGLTELAASALELRFGHIEVVQRMLGHGTHRLDDLCASPFYAPKEKGSPPGSI